MRLYRLGHSRFLAPFAMVAFAMLAACGSEPGPQGNGACAAGDPCGTEAAHGDRAGAPSRAPQPIEVVEYERPDEPRSPTCSDGYASAFDCRRPGLPVSIVDATPCCGLPTREATCCATAGQRCSNELGETCCSGLRCGSRCTCE